MTRFPDASRDSGSGSVLILIVIAVVVLLGSAVTVLLVGLAHAGRTQTVADVAAEAAALALVTGQPDPCARATRAADAAELEVARCDVLGDTVTVEVADPRPSAWWPQARAVARAGPSESPVP